VRIVLCYITVTGGPRTDLLAARFAASYAAFPPGVEHETLIACNGGEPDSRFAVFFAGFPEPSFFPRTNAGWDIGAYIQASLGPAAGADLIVCLGESVYFHRAGWLKRIVEAWEAYGEGMYGIFSSHVIRAHLNTTAFVTSPKILADYPVPVVSRQDRYEFEHGKMALWRLLAMHAKPTLLVTWDGVWPPGTWRRPANILWRGDQSNCLVWCNHVERYRDMTPLVRQRWQGWCDQAFT